MCGIIGYIGERSALPVMLDGLARLEYRGYDSAGIAVLAHDKIAVFKQPGKIKDLAANIPTQKFAGNLGIGHTRWATHGVPNEANAHPHTDCGNTLALVHNGIIENYRALKERLVLEDHKFRSQTDTEVIAHLIEENYKGDLVGAVLKSVKRLEGNYALGIIALDEPDKLVAARCGSPLLIGISRHGNFIASDASAVIRHTKDVIYLDDYEAAVLTSSSVKVLGSAGNVKNKKVFRINWDIKQAQKTGFAHFMLKEINEQPRSIANTLLGRVSKSRDEVLLPELRFSQDAIRSFNKLVIISCGTAYHAGLVGKYVLEELARITVEVDIASEARYRSPVIDKETLVVPISQSGETADTLAALREAKKLGAASVAICNVVGSSLTRETGATIYTQAGPEIAVASTKAYTSQLAVLYLFAIYLARARNTISRQKAKEVLQELTQLPALLKKTLDCEKEITRCARRYAKAYNFLYLGRNINFPNALEGALKLKEISYLHAEGYGAGEMKHGPIALITDKLPVVCIATQSAVYDKMLSNIQEIKARRGIIIAIATEGDDKIKEFADDVIYIPRIHELFSPILVALPLQLLAYHIAVKRGTDVDQPRNLAKSVTVE